MARRSLLPGILLTLTLTLVAGCGGADEGSGEAPATRPAPAPAPAAPPAVDASAEAEQIFDTRCATCHGPGGAGDGPGSAALDPKPRDFRDPAWQASVTDDHLGKIVLYGGAAVGKSPTMPSNPDLGSKPEVVRALIAHVRDLAGS